MIFFWTYTLKFKALLRMRNNDHKKTNLENYR